MSIGDECDGTTVLLISREVRMFKSGMLTGISCIVVLLSPLSVGAEVYPDAESAQALGVGDPAPDFVAWHPDGSEYRFDRAQRTRPALLIFYRGGWCPYCNLHLGQLGVAEDELRDLGYELLFLSADRPERIHANLEVENGDLGYTLLSDDGLRVAEAFGIAYEVSDEYQQRVMDRMGLDLRQETGLADPRLPVPAAFIVGRDGMIRFSFAEPDYRVRIDVEELLAVAREHAE
jgi:peroxiredoxin